MKRKALFTSLGLALSGALMLPAEAQDVLPRPEPKFKGVIERNAKDSVEGFPKPLQPPEGAPNILLILTDDVGFGASSTFGGPISTPNFDRLAERGLRYNCFHTTALSSPTRAALITGRNHHACSTGVIMEFATGYPGYNSLMSKSCGTVAEILKQYGYNTSWYGKNHNVPDWHTSQDGPFDLWPTGLGFQYFYGFLGGDTDQWNPNLFENTRPVILPSDDPDYILDRDLADHAISWIHTQKALDPEKPFFVYYSTGTAHAPHHAPKEWIDKYKGKFDQGWDKVREETFRRQKDMGVIPPDAKLTPRPKEIPAWDPLSADQKRLFARMMEVYAGALSHCDHQIGRVIDTIEELGELDNTLVIYIMGDNGASGEGTLQGLANEIALLQGSLQEDFSFLLSMYDKLGGPEVYGHYPVGWAHAMDTPFQWTKQIASHFGGTRNGMVMSWPERIKAQGEIRPQFHHVIDIVPTILEATGIKAPVALNGVPQKPIEGVSMAYTFDDPAAKTRRGRQYFEMLANRALYDNGWMASTTPKRLPWVMVGFASENPADDYAWELYNVDKDFSQAVNLVQDNPKKLRDLQDLWWVEAAKYDVLPLDDRFTDRVGLTDHPSLASGRTVFTYYPDTAPIPEGAAFNLKDRSFRVSADVEIPDNGASGVLTTQGGRFGGWALLMFDSKPAFHYTMTNQPQYQYRIASDKKLKPGKHTITFDFKYDGGGLGKGGTGTLYVDKKKAAQGRIERTVPLRFSVTETFDVGRDTATPVNEDYKVPFKFTGKLKKIVVDIAPKI
ncbi:MAG: arylsulfatase [Candidatus Omnitrophota bacterium]